MLNKRQTVVSSFSPFSSCKLLGQKSSGISLILDKPKWALKIYPWAVLESIKSPVSIILSHSLQHKVISCSHLKVPASWVCTLMLKVVTLLLYCNCDTCSLIYDESQSSNAIFRDTPTIPHPSAVLSCVSSL